jgi:hypothetical protein
MRHCLNKFCCVEPYILIWYIVGDAFIVVEIIQWKSSGSAVRVLTFFSEKNGEVWEDEKPPEMQRATLLMAATHCVRGDNLPHGH